MPLLKLALPMEMVVFSRLMAESPMEVVVMPREIDEPPMETVVLPLANDVLPTDRAVFPSVMLVLPMEDRLRGSGGSQKPLSPTKANTPSQRIPFRYRGGGSRLGMPCLSRVSCSVLGWVTGARWGGHQPNASKQWEQP